jgi:Xaa-Pro aminopeptidase/Xaa-Pro dipeptidase
MFEAEVYVNRRTALRRSFETGVLLFLGNLESPINFAANSYPFRQDSTFSYFFGLATAGLAAAIDVETGSATLFGDDLTLDDLIWHGETAPLGDRAAQAGVERVDRLAALKAFLDNAIRGGKPVHYLPPYRSETLVQLSAILDRRLDEIRAGASHALAAAIIALRERKEPREIAEMEAALQVTAQMHLTAMRASRPGVYERDVVGQMEGIVRRQDWQLAYPTIFSKRGEVLHNLHHHLQLEAGDLVVNDSGANSALGYASDITRTLPVGGRFTSRQRDVYDTVLKAQHVAIEAIRPGVPFVDLHKMAALTLVEGLKNLGLFKGEAGAVVESGAYAIAFQCGLGHQIGLDVHDMESFGEDLVGYDEEVARSPLFGLKNLRLGKRLVAGMTVTIEPGVYFIPQQIDQWAAEGRFADHIDYDRFRAYSDFGGIRIEDDVLVTETAARVLGPSIPKTASDLEAAMA